ncbi:MAG: 4-hydroxy-tetrahydrodipicolinate synthase [Bdellovibrionaceae bacterium]|nr:4-hydroxy-tetrahydrodipicolinate synthase [Bdellovibrio sp.]
MKSSANFNFHGVISALTTPFVNGEVDYGSLEKLITYQINNGINGFVINGTTAESPTLTWNEVEKIFATAKKIVNGRIPLIIGTGSNSTAHTIELTKKAEALGADAALVVVPYYNKPPQRGLVKHFAAVAKSTQLPIILYNVPGRTITAMSAETIKNLSEIKNIIGIKEASGDIAFDEQLKKELPSDFLLLSGDDGTYLPFLKLGGHGIISVMSNLIPKAAVQWTQTGAAGKYAEAETDFKKYKELINLMYVEPNPIPIKWMLYNMGIIKSPELRLPLDTLADAHFEKITHEMKSLGLL